MTTFTRDELLSDAERILKPWTFPLHHSVRELMSANGLDIGTLRDLHARMVAAQHPIYAQYAGPDHQLDRVIIGKGEYVRWDEAVKTVERLNKEIQELRADAQTTESQAKEPEASGGLCAEASHAVRVGEPARTGAVVGDQIVAEPSSKPEAAFLIEAAIADALKSKTALGYDATKVQIVGRFTMANWKHIEKLWTGSHSQEGNDGEKK